MNMYTLKHDASKYNHTHTHTHAHTHAPHTHTHTHTTHYAPIVINKAIKRYTLKHAEIINLDVNRKYPFSDHEKKFPNPAQMSTIISNIPMSIPAMHNRSCSTKMPIAATVL
jgi:hypothetical protein